MQCAEGTTYRILTLLKCSCVSYRNLSGLYGKRLSSYPSSHLYFWKNVLWLKVGEKMLNIVCCLKSEGATKWYVNSHKQQYMKKKII